MTWDHAILVLLLCTAYAEDPEYIIEPNANSTQITPTATHTSFPNPYVPICIATLVILTILLLIHCSYTDRRPSEDGENTSCFAYRSEDCNRYNTNQLRSNFYKRYNPFSSYPGPPEIQDADKRRYLGQSKLPHYRRPNVSIVNEQTREIIIDANDLSICYSLSKNKHSFTKSHSSTHLEELNKYKKFIEQCRKREVEKDSQDEELSKLILPVYKSRENIQEYFKNIKDDSEQAPDISLENISSKSWQKPPELSSSLEDVIERAHETTID